jgi:uncharacterized cupredoxin-like copper-binding protein
MFRAGTTLLLATLLSSCASSSNTGTVQVSARNSAFDPGIVRVTAGTRISFVVHNQDPIPHEFIIGTKFEQIAHESGTDENHDGTPGAASLDPGETQTVEYEFDTAGTFEFACHLAGHYAYGMSGEIIVT